MRVAIGMGVEMGFPLRQGRMIDQTDRRDILPLEIEKEKNTENGKQQNNQKKRITMTEQLSLIYCVTD